ncbi:MAG: hypothetical protein HOI82_02480, partial [Candidatus Magasanikbacteria bacterium]|nr:hypothetical protein [Candidatus Magasanikbacteria bacterium]
MTNTKTVKTQAELREMNYNELAVVAESLGLEVEFNSASKKRRLALMGLVLLAQQFEKPIEVSLEEYDTEGLSKSEILQQSRDSKVWHRGAMRFRELALAVSWVEGLRKEGLHEPVVEP